MDQRVPETIYNHPLPTTDLRNLNNDEFMESEKSCRFSKPPTPTTNTSLPEVQVQEFVARHKVGTIFASTTESDGAIIWGEHVAIKCEEIVEYDINNTSSHFPPYSSTLNNVQTQLLVKNLDTIQPQII